MTPPSTEGTAAKVDEAKTSDFRVRMGLADKPLVFDDFPQKARNALWYVLDQFVQARRLPGPDLTTELKRLARHPPGEEITFYELLTQLPWPDVYALCERVHAKLLVGTADWESEGGVELNVVQNEFSLEINQILLEENIGYEFREGRFLRPGRPHTQKMTARAHLVLARPQLAQAAIHYRKAAAFFAHAPNGDYENATKEAYAALEAAARAVFKDEFPGADFPTILVKLKGVEENEIPPTVVKSLTALFALRGAAAGVAHGGANGGVMTPSLTEFALNSTAAAITYLVDLADARGWDIPF